MDKTRNERQARFIKKQKENGLIAVKVMIKAEHKEELKEYAKKLK